MVKGYGLREDRKPVFKSSPSQFMTVIYSMEYEPENAKQGLSSYQVVTKLGVSWGEVGSKLGVSWEEVEKLIVVLQHPMLLSDLKDLYGGDAVLKETEYGYLYGDMPIYRVPSHEARMIVMKKELLPRCETKVYEGEDKKFKLINEQHLLYSNIFNMKEEKDGLGLIMMRDLKFYYPDEIDFHYVKLVVDRMERVESELDKIKSL